MSTIAKAADITSFEWNSRDIRVKTHSKVLHCLLAELALSSEECGFVMNFRVAMARRVDSGLLLPMK
jgi:hypothetical protein